MRGSAMSAALKEREVDIAWREHQFGQGGRSLERAKALAAARATRIFKTEIAPDADLLKGVCQSPGFRQLFNDWARKGAVGRERKLLKLKQMLAPASACPSDGALLVAWLQPHGGMVCDQFPSLSQAGVIVAMASLSRASKAVRVRAFPCLEVSDHALRRMLERAPGISPRQALLGAALAFVAADRHATAAAQTVYLRAGPGLFLATPLGMPVGRAWWPGRIRGLLKKWRGRISARLRRPLIPRGASSRRLFAGDELCTPQALIAPIIAHEDKSLTKSMTGRRLVAIKDVRNRDKIGLAL